MTEKAKSQSAKFKDAGRDLEADEDDVRSD